VEGDPGHFSARVYQTPRYVDISKCTSCADCEAVCPVELQNDYEEGLTTRKAIFKKYTQAIPGTYAIQKTSPAPCKLACPAGLNVQGYVQMVKMGNYKRALEIIMEDLPFPGILGRVCTHGCEDACRRCEVDQPVAIRDLKRLAADQYDPREIQLSSKPKRDEKVAIIGSGPAGLSTGYFLARKGIGSTVFEALPEPGGMLRVGIPEHRLPREVLEKEIEVVTNLGVEIKTNTPFGPNLTIDQLFQQGFKAVYLAIGAHKGIELGVPGENLKGVRQGVAFLKDVALKGTTEIGKKVAIIGGGNVAIDVARSAIRLGAEEVSVIYRRSRDEMPAFKEEIQATLDEGVNIVYLSAPQEILSDDGEVAGVRCIRMELGKTDSSGRRSPIPIPGSEFDLEVDQVISAIGQQPDLSSLTDITGLEFSRWGTIEVNSVSYATDIEGVFAGGDAQAGPWTVIGAVATGKEAAESIERYFDGVDMSAGREIAPIEDVEYRPVDEVEPGVDRVKMPELPAAQRAGNFNQVELGYTEEEGQSEASRCINCSYCSDCGLCVEACLPGAVNHMELPVERDLDVGAVILTSGTDVFDPAKLEQFYLYKHNPNVMTSIEFERILSATGPTNGHLVRRSDDKEPKKIAWLQCVGSRDVNQCDNGYCSSVCCMYAIKEAVIAKEHAPSDLDCAIFNMDIRTFGKDYERYYERSKELGVRFVQARVHTIEDDSNTGNLLLRYATVDGEVLTEEYDMVVLSVGMEPARSAVEMAKEIGIELNQYNFVQSEEVAPVASSKPGIYVAGVFQGPKDIPHSIMEASAAACAAGLDLSSARGSLVKERVFPEEKDITGEEPRIGVFVCNCGTNIGGIANVPEIVDYVKGLPNVVHAEHNMFSCSQDTQEKMVNVIKENNLNRVVVAACSPITHEPLFQETLKDAGLNPFLFDMANIRNQCTWVHSDEKEKATEKSKDLVRMSIARSRYLEPLEYLTVGVNNPALVIGGGISGMTAALGFADQGFPTTLIEKTDELGGSAARQLKKTWKGSDITAYIQGQINKVENHQNITVLKNTEVVDSSGFVGNFETELKVGDLSQTIKHGATVVATGGRATDTDEYLYGQNPRVTQWHDIEENLDKFDDINTVVFINCVGSRDESHPYCSKLCCTASIQEALQVKERFPDARIFVLHRGIRTYGEREDLYREAREKGIIFIKYTPETKPTITEVNGKPEVLVFDAILGRYIQIEADLVNLATAIEPEENNAVTSAFKLPVNEDGFIMEAHVKLRPVDCSTDGVYICGMVHYPKPFEESITQAQAAVSRAVNVLCRQQVNVEPIVSTIDQDLCIGCGLCIKTCSFSAIEAETIEGLGVRAKNISALCKGCGVCAVACPQQAIYMNHFNNDQINAAIKAGKSIA